ncbi:MAG: anaerobic ribonucleoside-triphosphate reductase activating protein [Bacteroidaceae bacterium]|nr:anaerobic ribonucleoside-triphosphate reductase activating protein [Bacteroidaceae bacterium]
MLKYVNTDIVFQEIPDEISLAINISACPCHCPGCHSKYLWTDIGLPLNEKAIDTLIGTFQHEITCVAFMGGDADPSAVNRLAAYVRQTHSQLKTAWYTGRTVISGQIYRANFDYIKVGPYISHLGPLNHPTTNQRLYKVTHPQGELVDITHKFWGKGGFSV